MRPAELVPMAVSEMAKMLPPSASKAGSAVPFLMLAKTMPSKVPARMYSSLGRISHWSLQLPQASYLKY